MAFIRVFTLPVQIYHLKVYDSAILQSTKPDSYETPMFAKYIL